MEFRDISTTKISDHIKMFCLLLDYSHYVSVRNTTEKLSCSHLISICCQNSAYLIIVQYLRWWNVHCWRHYQSTSIHFLHVTTAFVQAVFPRSLFTNDVDISKIWCTKFREIHEMGISVVIEKIFEKFYVRLNLSIPSIQLISPPKDSICTVENSRKFPDFWTFST